MAGSIITIFRWSLLRFTSLTLLFLWAFNPLGSQASFRAAFLQDMVQSKSGTITYFKPDSLQQIRMNMLSINGSKTDITAAYSLAMYDTISRTQHVDNTSDRYLDLIETLGGKEAAGIWAATDPWGNIRIPNLEYLDGYDTMTPNKWLEIPWNKSVQNYASLIGDTFFQGVERAVYQNTTFNITTNYQSFNCSPWSTVNEDASDAWMQENLNRTGGDSPNPWRYAYSEGNGVVIANQENFWVTSPRWETECQTPSYHTPLFFGTPVRTGPEQNIDLRDMKITQCSLATTHIDAQVDCTVKASSTRASCGVSRVRRMPDPPIPIEYSLLDHCVYHPNGMIETNSRAPNVNEALMTLLLDPKANSKPGIVAKYLYNPLSAPSSTSDNLMDVGSLDVRVLEKRLSLLYNTLWKAGWMTAKTFTPNYTALKSFGWTENTTSQVSYLTPPVYAFHLPWMILYFISVGVMFSAALASLILHSQCRAPPILW